MKSVLAQSISLHLHRALPAKCALRVLSVHRRVLNLEAENGQLLAFIHPQIGLGPFHIQLTHAVDFSSLRPGMTGWKDGALYQVGGLRIDGRRLHLWDATLPPAPSPFPTRSWQIAQEAAEQRLQTHPVAAELNKPTWTRLQSGLQALSQGLQTHHQPSIAAAVDQLAGLGPGLTPAGDDLLLGAMARVFFLESNRNALPDASSDPAWEAGVMFERAAMKTNRLSRAWLWHAAHRRFSEPWHALHEALTQADENRIRNAIHRIAAIGATSGRLALMGLFSMH